MTNDLIKFTQTKKCVFYNDLSHMNPIYAVPGVVNNINKEEEVLFHKRNIFLLALSFEHIVICTDNILTFTKHLQKDVIQSVVEADWFVRLVEAGIIIFCGWGARRNVDMMQNQIEYSNLFRPELKDSSYVDHLKSITNHTLFLVREYDDGEHDHIRFLLPQITGTRDAYSASSFSRLEDLIGETQTRVGYVGSMEIFPNIDKWFGGNSGRDLAFYRAYFRSWQEYSSTAYSPAITIDTSRNLLPGRLTFGDANSEGAGIASALYSPDFFLRYLERRLGKDVALRILGLRAENLIRIRNGDWKVFLDEYHRCLRVATNVSWISEIALSGNFLADDYAINTIIDRELVQLLKNDIDLELFAAILGGAFSYIISAGPLVPIVKLFRKKINNIIHRFTSQLGRGKYPTERFIEKFQYALNGKEFTSLRL